MCIVMISFPVDAVINLKTNLNFLYMKPFSCITKNISPKV